MYLRFLMLCIFIFIFSCRETVFNAGLENRLIAVIDMAPEPGAYGAKLDFTSDEETSSCVGDNDYVTLDKFTDGSADNTYYTITIDAKDHYKTENNCTQYGWTVTNQESVKHQLKIVIYTQEISEQMYIGGSRFLDHPDEPTNQISAYYLLERDENGNDNSGNGVAYYGDDAEIDIVELDLANGLITGSLNVTLFRGNHAPSSIAGVDNPSDLNDLDLFNPAIDDPIFDYNLTDSIRIEDCIFQRVTVINNI